jgi:hypothetical protein
MELALGSIIGGVLAFLLGAVVRPYVSAYSTKKGENLATHEDIDKLVNQVKAITITTEEIKAEISTGLWDRQRRWGMKREVLFEAVKRLAEIDDALLSASIALKEDRKRQGLQKAQGSSPEEELSWGEIRAERMTRWTKASMEFDGSHAFVTTVCSRETGKVFWELGAFINKLAADMTKDIGAYDDARPELFKKILMAQMAIRKELEVDVIPPNSAK